MIGKLLLYLDWPFLRLMGLLVERFRVGLWGPLDAFRYNARLDTWERNNDIREALLGAVPRGQALVLDVGGNANELSRLLPDRFSIVVLDLDRAVLSGRAVCADAAHLPFRDGIFDAVVSVDTLEHIPDAFRRDIIAHMLRVRRDGAPVVLHFPAHDGGQFLGENYDRSFLAWHRRLFGKGDRNTEEHLENGLPGVNWLRDQCPGVRLEGRQHGPTWLRYMILERIPFLRLLAVFLYRLKKSRTSPYHACLAEIP